MEKYLARELVSYTFEEAVEDAGKLSKYIKALFGRLKEFWRRCDTSSTYELTLSEMRLHRRTFDSHRKKNPIVFLCGYYSATLDVFKWLLEERETQEAIQAEVSSQWRGQISHFESAIAAIHENPGIRHVDLAAVMKTPKSTLTGMMEKMVDLGVATYSRPGKFKYYYLTPAGESYYAAHAKQIELHRSEEFQMSEAINFLAQSADPAKEIGKFVSQIIEELNLEKEAFPQGTQDQKEFCSFTQFIWLRASRNQAEPESVTESEKHITEIIASTNAKKTRKQPWSSTDENQIPTNERFKAHRIPSFNICAPAMA